MVLLVRVKHFVGKKYIEHIFIRFRQIIRSLKCLLNITERHNDRLQFTFMPCSVRESEPVIPIHITGIVITVADKIVQSKFRLAYIGLYVYIVVTKTGGYGIHPLNPPSDTGRLALDDVIDNHLYLAVSITDSRIVDVFYPNNLRWAKG